MDRVSVRSLAGFVGLLQSLSRTTGPIVSVMTRSLYREIAKARSWSSFCKLTELAHFELSWWKDNIKFLSKYPNNESPIGLVSGFNFASDSSSVGLFSY